MEQLAQETANLLSTSAGLLVLVLGAVAGLIIGLLFAAFGWKRKDDAVTNTRVAAVKTELEDYKSDVNQHFAKTATLVNQLTSDYRAVYDHLASSSAKLCDADGLKLGFDDTIRLDQKDITEQPNSDERAGEPEAEKPDLADDKPAETASPEKQQEPAVAASIPEKIAKTTKSDAKPS